MQGSDDTPVVASDRAASEEDQTASDEDQAAASNGDQPASDEDQIASDQVSRSLGACPAAGSTAAGFTELLDGDRAEDLIRRADIDLLAQRGGA